MRSVKGLSALRKAAHPRLLRQGRRVRHFEHALKAEQVGARELGERERGVAEGLASERLSPLGCDQEWLARTLQPVDARRERPPFLLPRSPAGKPQVPAELDQPERGKQEPKKLKPQRQGRESAIESAR